MSEWSKIIPHCNECYAVLQRNTNLGTYICPECGKEHFAWECIIEEIEDETN